MPAAGHDVADLADGVLGEIALRDLFGCSDSIRESRGSAHPDYEEPPVDPQREYAIERIAACMGITIDEAREQLEFDDFVAIEIAERAVQAMQAQPYIEITLPYSVH